MVTLKRNHGYTLTEMMLVVAILGILSTAGAQLMTQANRYWILTSVRVDLQKEARSIMYLISRNLRQAQSGTILIDRVSSSQLFYTRITFTKIQGTTMTFHQNGNQIIQTVGSNTKILSKNLRYLSFDFPRSDDLTIVSVAVTLEKTIYEGKKKALQMASEKVRVMN